MSSETVKYLAVELNSGCDSDFEIINNSDGEPETGYQRLQVKDEFDFEQTDRKTGRKSPDGRSQSLGGLLKSKHSDKIVLSLSQEQIYLLTEKRSDGSETSEAIKKSRSSFFSSAFSVVPIKVHDSAPAITKPHLPEIVLTSFENNSPESRKDANDKHLNESAFGKQDLISVAQPEPKESFSSNHSLGYGLDSEKNDESGSVAVMKPLNLNNLSPYCMPYDIGSHRPSEAGLSMCHSELDHNEHQSYHETIPSDFRCRLCDNVFKDPRTLNCLHSFCLECLINEHLGNDASIPLWSGTDGISYDWRGNSEVTYQTSNSSSNHESDFPTPLPSDSRSSTESNKKLEKPEKKNLRSQSIALQPVIATTETGSKLRAIKCSICQHSTEIPLGGIIQLPQNCILSRKIENYMVSVRENGIVGMWCNLCCDAVTATHHCTTCSINLCGFCKEAHERQRSTAHHNIHSTMELRRLKESRKSTTDGIKLHLKCPLHPGFELKQFCLTCQEIICSECNALLHKGHKTEAARKVCKIFQKLLKDSIEKTKPICEYANHSITKLAAISKKINEKCDQVQHEVELHMASYFEALEVHRKTLLQQISRARITKMQMIMEQQYDLENRSSQAKAVVEFSEELITIGTEAEILSFVNLLMKRFEFCHKYKPLLDSKISDTLHFLPEVRAPSTKAQNNIPMFGIITTQTVEPGFCTMETEGLDQLRVHRKAELVILSRDSDGMPLCHGGLTLNAVLKYKESSGRPLPFQISDRRDGSYIISFSPDTTGILVLSVMIKTKHIKGSPFTLRAKSIRPHSGNFHCCAFCSSKGSKTATCACEGAMQGFKGCGHGHPGHPGRRHWSCCASVLENSECTST